MKNIRVLDCTLRDGGRIIDCAFADRDIQDIADRLAETGIDIIEIGFLRDGRKWSYRGNSTFFTDVEQIERFIDRKKHRSMYVAFVDYGMFDFDSLKPFDGRSVDGIRVGFTKGDFSGELTEIIKSMKHVKDLGYKLFVQGVNSLGYKDREILELVDIMNELKPYSFGIVDTYGAMYSDDVQRIYSLIDNNMEEDICIDFHSHNNFQLSFALAQEVIKLSQGSRQIILDATLDGVGKCAGNLNTELICDYLVRKMNYDYDLDGIFDIIDDHMFQMRMKYEWGYSIPAVMAGIYKSHPNNIIYLTEKFRLSTKDIKHIISMIEPELRQRYDYDNIQRVYMEYNHTKVDDKEALKGLRKRFSDRNVLLLMPGSSLNEYGKEIDHVIEEVSPVVISVNFVSERSERDSRYAFFGSEKRYKRFKYERSGEQAIVVSNIESDTDTDIIVNYESLIERDNRCFDSSSIMLLNLLRKTDVSKIWIAGFDGFQKGKSNYFQENIFEGGRFQDSLDDITRDMMYMLKRYADSVKGKMSIQFITPSLYEGIFDDLKTP